jgi:P-type E1-E2 ATPase
VIRDGKQEVIDAEYLVPGDLVVLEEGDAIPADLRLCEVAQLEVIEAILTGESLPTSKNIRTIRKRVCHSKLVFEFSANTICMFYYGFIGNRLESYPLVTAKVAHS